MARAGQPRQPAAPAEAQNDMPPLPHPVPTDAGRAAFVMPETLRKRGDFLAAARARRQGAGAFLLQARDRGDQQPARIGYTCSKKIGNAVARNRAKRRLRAIARAVLPGAARPGWDYVLVGRPQATITADFAAMTADLATALSKVHR